jgi:transposase
LVRERKHQEFDQWIESAKASDIRELRTFAVGLLRDKGAVLAALTFPWSNGQVEGPNQPTQVDQAYDVRPGKF